MRKKTILVAVMITVFGAMQVNAQFSIGLEPGIMKYVGENVSDENLLAGGNLTLNYTIKDKFRIGAVLGLYADVEYSSSKLVPTLLSAEYKFLDRKFSPYAGINIGAYTFMENLGGGDIDANPHFAVAPLVGIEYAASPKLSLVSSLKYNYIHEESSSLSAIGFNVGLRFSFVK